MFGRWYGWDRVPWCAEGFSYCYVKAGSVSFKTGERYAYVPYIVADARAGRNNLAVVSIAHVKPGNGVCFDWRDDGVSDHVGFFERWIRDASEFSTVEFNADNMVARKTRSVRDVQVFVHVGK